MPKHQVKVRCKVPSSFAVDQVRGMFDLRAAKEATEVFNVELPDREELIDGKPWQIGVIVGPSGSGKSTVARNVYGSDFFERCDWDQSKAVVDHFEGIDMRLVTGTLNAVGFSSPPAWVKPHQVLSGGERFRCDLARALLSPGDLVAFDEFTSVVDRTVAKIGSAAIAKSIRKGRITKQFVAVTCHYDILEWLEPDWVLDMASGQLARGCLYRRPQIELALAPVHRSAWRLFRRHHYLNHDICTGAKCFCAFLGDEPVAFSSWINRMTRGQKKLYDMREHRTVVLPDFQGIGIGNRVSEVCASIWAGLGGRAFSTTSHPAMIRYRNKSKLWRTIRHGMVSPYGRSARFLQDRIRSGKANSYEHDLIRTLERNQGKPDQNPLNSSGRITGGFQYVGPRMDSGQAESWLTSSPDVFCPAGAIRAIILVLLDIADLTLMGALARKTGFSETRMWSGLRELIPLGHVHRVDVGPRAFFGLTESGRRRFADLSRLSDLEAL